MRRPFVAGNWKLNGSRVCTRELVAGVCEGARALPGVEVGLCPAFVYVADARAAIGDAPVRLGGQNCAGVEQGAFTGEVSACMLADVGCDFVLVGHSERRTLYAEGDTDVARKAGLALAAGLSPVVCVGETLEEREAGQTESTVGRQLDAVVERLDRDGLARIVIAYEPVWAIGTGRTASPAQANAVHAFLRERVAVREPNVATGLRILYGGSVKAENAARIFAEPDVDGGLIGGASLDAEQFIDICRSAS
jgi:triosephosphate isomerase